MAVKEGGQDAAADNAWKAYVLLCQCDACTEAALDPIAPVHLEYMNVTCHNCMDHCRQTDQQSRHERSAGDVLELESIVVFAAAACTMYTHRLSALSMRQSSSQLTIPRCQNMRKEHGAEGVLAKTHRFAGVGMLHRQNLRPLRLHLGINHRRMQRRVARVYAALAIITLAAKLATVMAVHGKLSAE